MEIPGQPFREATPQPSAIKAQADALHRDLVKERLENLRLTSALREIAETDWCVNIAGRNPQKIAAAALNPSETSAPHRALSGSPS